MGDTCRSDKGWSCRMPGWVVPLSEVKRHSSLDAKFYCYAVYTKETGSTKKSYELELLQGSYQRKLSIFACDYNNVFSDVDAQIGSDYPTIKVSDVDHEFHVVKRKKQGTWVNTAMFQAGLEGDSAKGRAHKGAMGCEGGCRRRLCS